MTSSIDNTFPPDDEKVDKALMRANFAAAKTEIEDLQRKVRLPWQVAFDLVKFSTT